MTNDDSSDKAPPPAPPINSGSDKTSPPATSIDQSAPGIRQQLISGPGETFSLTGLTDSINRAPKKPMAPLFKPKTLSSLQSSTEAERTHPSANKRSEATIKKQLDENRTQPRDSSRPGLMQQLIGPDGPSYDPGRLKQIREPGNPAKPTPSTEDSVKPSASRQEVKEVEKKDVSPTSESIEKVRERKDTYVQNRVEKAEGGATVHFMSGKSDITLSAAGKIWSSFSEQERRDLQTKPEVVLMVSGFASPSGTADFNLKVSQERADKVGNILKERYGIVAKIEAKGLGVRSDTGDSNSDNETDRKVVVGIDTSPKQSAQLSEITPPQPSPEARLKGLIEEAPKLADGKETLREEVKKEGVREIIKQTGEGIAETLEIGGVGPAIAAFFATKDLVNDIISTQKDAHAAAFATGAVAKMQELTGQQYGGIHKWDQGDLDRFGTDLQKGAEWAARRYNALTPTARDAWNAAWRKSDNSMDLKFDQALRKKLGIQIYQTE